MRSSINVRTYAEWDRIRISGRGGKKKIRRDTTLAMRPDNVLTFSYGDELLATLDKENTYTFSMDTKGRYYPTHSNIFALIGKITMYRDTSHYKHHAQPLRIAVAGERYVKDPKTASGWKRTRNTIPFTNGLQYRNGECLNPEIAQDFKRTLNRAKSLPFLRKTEVLAKVLRVATRMRLLERDRTLEAKFEDINLDEPTAADAEIILRKGSAMGLWGWRSQDPEQKHAALIRAAENGLADYREWLYLKHDCYEMLPVVPSSDQPEGETQ
jgi:hypothetical protein